MPNDMAFPKCRLSEPRKRTPCRASTAATVLLLSCSLHFAPLFVLIVPALLWRAVEDFQALDRSRAWATPILRSPDRLP